MPTKHATTPLDPPMVVTGYTPLEDLIDVPPPPFHYYAAIIDGDWVIFDQVNHGLGTTFNIYGDNPFLDHYVGLQIADKPLLSVLTVRPAHARYAFYYGDYGKDNPDKPITRSEASGLRYMEALKIAFNYIALFRKLNTSNERRMEIGDWQLEYYTPKGKLLTRKFWIVEEHILDENDPEETEW